MPFSKCPICGGVFHLFVGTDITAWYAKHAAGKKVGEEVSLECFECWKELKEYDVVEVIATPDSADDVEIGDFGAVLLVLESKDGKKAFEVESVLPDGRNKWLHTFERHQLRYSVKKNKPHKAPEPTTMAVTAHAPSSTSRASHDCGSP